uniref:(northern house mosquito) hypothetical protein n=1 Tax=Culex pipiens TaxID=7175 RepID=A0A8D8FE87_CULPI
MIVSVSNSLPSLRTSFLIPSSSGIVLTIREISFFSPNDTKLTAARNMMLAKWSPGRLPGVVLNSATVTESSASDRRRTFSKNAPSIHLGAFISSLLNAMTEQIILVEEDFISDTQLAAAINERHFGTN